MYEQDIFMLSWVENEKSFITLGPDQLLKLQLVIPV